MTNEFIPPIRARREAIKPAHWEIDERTAQGFAAPEIVDPYKNMRRVAKCLLDIGSEGMGEALRNAEFIAHAPQDIDTLLAENERLQRELGELRRIHNKTAELFDALGIWTGADDLLWDRLIYLIDGMGGYCDPTKIPESIKAIRAKLYGK